MKGIALTSRADVHANIISRAIRTKTGCLELSGAINSKGYPCIGVPVGKVELAHRFMWEHHNGQIPEGLQVHHRCENKRCCEITHLDALTQTAHAAIHRPTHCTKGHEFTAENSIYHKKGTRTCRICHREYMQKWHQARRDKLIQESAVSDPTT